MELPDAQRQRSGGNVDVDRRLSDACECLCRNIVPPRRTDGPVKDPVAAQQDVLRDAAIRRDQHFLEHRRDAGRLNGCRTCRDERSSFDQDAALARRDNAREQLDERALA
jgi:hypothetical protein